MIHWYKPKRNLRSSSQFLVQENGVQVGSKKKVNIGTYGSRAFSICAPKMWNALPDDVRSCASLDIFKGKLKTHLFKTAFNV